MQDLRQNAYAPPTCLPRHWEAIPSPSEGVTQSDPYDLTAVGMPPELYDVDEAKEGPDANEGKSGRLALFAEDVSMINTARKPAEILQVVPPPFTAFGWTLRGILIDIITLFEVNRKECARILLSLRTFFEPGTFKPVTPPEEPASTLSLESLIVTILLGNMLTLPTSPGPLIYYASVITELCKASPNTVAPPVGRAVRKLFTMMGEDGLDVEVCARLAEWFAMHLSNFGFQWMWKEWWVLLHRYNQVLTMAQDTRPRVAPGSSSSGLYASGSGPRGQTGIPRSNFADATRSHVG